MEYFEKSKKRRKKNLSAKRFENRSKYICQTFSKAETFETSNSGHTPHIDLSIIRLKARQIY